MTISWRRTKLTGSNIKRLRGPQNHENSRRGLVEERRRATDLRQRGRNRKTVHATMIREDRRRKARNQNQQSGRRKRALLGAMTQRRTANQKRVRSQSLRETSGNLLLRSHRLLAPLPGKTQNWNQRWRLRVRKVRGEKS